VYVVGISNVVQGSFPP